MKSLVSAETAERFRAALRRLAIRWPRTSTRVSAARYSVELLLERRIWLFAGINAVLVFQSLLEALSTGARVG